MKLRVLGMPTRDAMAFDLFMQKNMPDWQWGHGLADQGKQQQEVDIWVIDMAAQGWGHCSDVNLASLHELISQQSAVLLVSGQDQTWSNLTATEPVPNCIWLKKPYGALGMKEALAQIVRARHVPQMQKVFGDKPQFEVVAMAVTTNEIEKKSLNAIDNTSGLSSEALLAKLALVPLDRYILLRKISDKLTTPRPFEVRFTVQNSLIVNPGDQWVSTNTPLQVIQRVCNSNALAAAVSIRDIDTTEAEERTQRLAMDVTDLFVFLRDISSSLAWQEPFASR